MNPTQSERRMMGLGLVLLALTFFVESAILNFRYEPAFPWACGVFGLMAIEGVWLFRTGLRP